jgi:hypothetical protein
VGGKIKLGFVRWSLVEGVEDGRECLTTPKAKFELFDNMAKANYPVDPYATGTIQGEAILYIRWLQPLLS